MYLTKLCNRLFRSVKLVKELDSTRSSFTQELERLIKKHQQELDKETKQQQGDDRKYQKHIEQMQDQEIKGFVQQQKKEYKEKKEHLKEVKLSLLVFVCHTSDVYLLHVLGFKPNPRE